MRVGPLQHVVAKIDEIFDAQQGHLFPWAAVCFGFGISLFFALRFEPGLFSFLGAGTLAGGGYWLSRHSMGRRAVGWFILCAALGFSVAGYRAHSVAAPVLKYRYYGPVEGRLISVDRSQSDALRLTLDQVYLPKLDPEDWPAKLRISARALDIAPPIGARVMTTAHLSPPQGPVEPGGFDFRRHVWFQKIGAVGYTRVPVLLAARPSRDLWINRLRAKISGNLQHRYPGQTGAVATAILTGDRSGINQETLNSLRASNLAHLLAISGLHMGLLSGIIFTGARFGLVALNLMLHLSLNAKSIAAALALVAATGYLLISGGNVATERAYIMTAVILIAVLLQSRALTLRAVAIAALIVLAHRPESLLSPGFQMSFAATTALVAVFAALRHLPRWHWPNWLRPVVALVISSAIAGLATAPIGAAHFNTLSQVGLVANLLAVPVMGSLVMPAAALAAVLTPLGLEHWPLDVMSWGLNWILNVAETIAEIPFAQRTILQPPNMVLPIICMGALFVILWQGRARWFGLAGVIIGLTLWSAAARPALLIASDGALIGLQTPEGRALSRARGAGFTARVWLENDGAPQTQAFAAARWPQEAVQLGGVTVISVAGKRAAAEIQSCDPNEVIIANLHTVVNGGCLILDPKTLAPHGAVSVTKKGAVQTARAQTGLRLWSPPAWQKTVSLQWPEPR
ncbi:competence protein ComEC [Epibacterium ulvae]|uniref:Competence protein ComEC n=1 Tax=Epibacterium ulvae TaxID=1156985 RepID=A0A1G5Q710_9RHOB|nr:ComEC/Rec2 family competence protein [Epibacterium ulvae]SCZ57408.1 competence protein ComEC [Epibacterium ulvae]